VRLLLGRCSHARPHTPNSRKGRRAIVSVARTSPPVAPHIEELEHDHPERRFVAALCLYSHAVDMRQLDRPFRQDDAECFARLLLMPDEARDPVAGWPDAELAELFTAPLDQVAARRRDRTTRRPNG
jgi:hypothetical protein